MTKVALCAPLIGILCLITIKTCEAAKCLQDAQHRCQKESAGLIEAGQKQSGVCSAYADYESCIRTSIEKLGCRLLPSEAELHETDITNVYTNYPYGCTKTQNGWIASLTARSSAPRLLSLPTLWLLLAIMAWLWPRQNQSSSNLLHIRQMSVQVNFIKCCINKIILRLVLVYYFEMQTFLNFSKYPVQFVFSKAKKNNV